jgi:transcriptional regulator with XRE-family HTH domain
MNFNLLKALKEKNLTQRDLARIINEHESVVSRIINGIWNPDEARKIKYAKALGRKPEELFSGEEN